MNFKEADSPKKGTTQTDYEIPIKPPKNQKRENVLFFANDLCCASTKYQLAQNASTEEEASIFPGGMYHHNILEKYFQVMAIYSYCRSTFLFSLAYISSLFYCPASTAAHPK